MPLNRGVIRDQSRLQQLTFEVFSRLLMTYKYVLSFRKMSWDLDDYPIQTYFMTDNYVSRNEQEVEKRKFLDLPWMARILNWPLMLGLGATSSDAIAKLRENFDKYKENYKLPRPGTNIKANIIFTPQNEAMKLHSLAQEFFKKIFDIQILFYNDSSTLSDYQDFSDGEDVHKKIVENFNVDVSAIADGNIVEILKKIQEARTASE